MTALARIGFTALVLTLSLGAGAQGSGKQFQVGVVFNTLTPEDLANPIRPGSAGHALIEGLRALGWTDGRNVRIYWRSADGHPERIPAILKELTSLPVDVLVLHDTAREAAKQTRTIPIVSSFTKDPVATGLVQSLARPGGNITGVLSWSRETSGKALSLLKEALPSVTRVAVFSASGQWLPGEIVTAAKQLKVDLVPVKFPESPAQVDAAIGRAKGQGAGAVAFGPTPLLYRREHQTAVHAATKRHRVPSFFFQLSAIPTGGLMGYGDDFGTNYQERVPYYLDRIFRGDRPGDIPIEQNERVEFHVNLKTAQAIGVTIPKSVLLQANRVYE